MRQEIHVAGIAVILRTDGREDARGVVERMTQAMAFRGPDGLSHWSSGSVALGHCRMDTTTEALKESQPCVSEDGNLVLVMDGYLSNWEELRRELLERGARLRNRSDAELVLHAYQEWGEDCPRHIDGEYALIIWDARLRKLFCARDHQGLRPLYYYWDGTSFIAASELNALHAALPSPPPLNRGYVAEIMANRWYTRDETVWAGIMRLPGAHSLSLQGEQPHLSRYWQLPTDISITYKRDEDYFEHYRELLSDCVRRASRSHRPMAYEVSGGLDSSALFSLAHWLLQDGRLPSDEIRAYTLAGEPGTYADEIHYARLVGQFVGRPVNEIDIFSPGIDWYLQQAVEDCDMTTYPNCAMSIRLEQSAARDGCRAIMTGNGGDQWLDGAPRYYDEQLRTGDWRGIGASLRDDISDIGWRQTFIALLKNALAPHLSSGTRRALRRFRPGSSATMQMEPYWLSAELRNELARRAALFNSRVVANWRSEYKYAKVDFPFLPIALDLMGRQRAKSGLEGRSPMMSRAFIEFCSTTPEITRLRGGLNKFIHRKAMAGLMPIEICDRRTKAYFDPVFWQRQKAASLHCQSALDNGFTQLVDREGLLRMLQEYSDETIDNAGTWEVWGTFAGAALTNPKISASELKN